MKRTVILAVAALAPSLACAANSLPGNRELLAVYCSVVLNVKLDATSRVAAAVEKDPKAPPKFKKQVAETLTEFQEQRRRLDSFLAPVLVAAQESDGNAYVLSLLSSKERAEADISTATKNEAGASDATNRMKRCADLSWLP